MPEAIFIGYWSTEGSHIEDGDIYIPDHVVREGEAVLCVFTRHGRFLQTCVLIGQEVQLISCCPIRASSQKHNNALIGWPDTTNRPPLV